MHPIKLNISFLKSCEDRRLQLISINGAIFAIFHAPLESDVSVRLECEDWNLILLKPIKSKGDIVISGINVICLNQIETQEGLISVHANRHLVKFGNLITPAEKSYETSGCGTIHLDQEFGMLIYYHRLFQEIVQDIRGQDPQALSLVQKKMMMALCTFADKIEGGANSLDLRAVLDIWGVDTQYAPHS